MRPPRAQLRRVAPVGGQRSAFEGGAAGPDQAGDRRDALSQGGRAVRPPEYRSPLNDAPDRFAKEDRGCPPPSRRHACPAGRLASTSPAGAWTRRATRHARHPRRTPRRVPRPRCCSCRSLVVLRELHCESQSCVVQSLPMQAVQATCGGNRSHVPRVHLSRQIPDGGHADHAMGKREQRCAPLLRSWGSRSRMCASVAARSRSQRTRLAVRRIVDRLVSIHRGDTEPAYSATVARQRRGDGSLLGAEKARSDAETAGHLVATRSRGTPSARSNTILARWTNSAAEACERASSRVVDSRAAPSRERCAGGDVSTLTAAAAPIDGQVIEGRAEPRPAEARAR